VNKLTKEEVNNRLAGRGIVLLGGYVNVSTKSLFQCNKGHTWSASPRNVLHGETGCPYCSGNKPLTKEIVNDRLAERGIVMLDEYINQNTKALFQCSEGHSWNSAPTNVLYGNGCPECGRNAAANKRKLTPDKICERLSNRGIDLIGEYVTANTKTLFQCCEGHTWEATPGSVMSGNGCPYCSNRAPLTKEIVNNRIAGRGIILLSEFVTTSTRSQFQCSERHTWISTPGGVMQGSGCPHCDGQAPLSKEIVNERIANRGFHMLGEYVNVDTKAQFQCSEWHSWETTPYHVMRGTGCPYCSRQAPLSTEIVNNRIADRGLILLDEFITNSVKVRFQCSEGHIWEAKPNNILNGRGCPYCSERTSDNNTFYIWVADRQNLVNIQIGEFLVKYGVTSERLGDKRINEVASTWGTLPHILAMVKTLVPATWAEQAAEDIGRCLAPDYSYLDGWTEFRIVNETELAQIMAIAHEAAKYKIVWNNPAPHIKDSNLIQLKLDFQ